MFSVFNLPRADLTTNADASLRTCHPCGSFARVPTVLDSPLLETSLFAPSLPTSTRRSKQREAMRTHLREGVLSRKANGHRDEHTTTADPSPLSLSPSQRSRLVSCPSDLDALFYPPSIPPDERPNPHKYRGQGFFARFHRLYPHAVDRFVVAVDILLPIVLESGVLQKAYPMLKAVPFHVDAEKETDEGRGRSVIAQSVSLPRLEVALLHLLAGFGYTKGRMYPAEGKDGSDAEEEGEEEKGEEGENTDDFPLAHDYNMVVLLSLQDPRAYVCEEERKAHDAYALSFMGYLCSVAEELVLGGGGAGEGARKIDDTILDSDDDESSDEGDGEDPFASLAKAKALRQAYEKLLDRFDSNRAAMGEMMTPSSNIGKGEEGNGPYSTREAFTALFRPSSAPSSAIPPPYCVEASPSSQASARPRPFLSLLDDCVTFTRCSHRTPLSAAVFCGEDDYHKHADTCKEGVSDASFAAIPMCPVTFHKGSMFDVPSSTPSAATPAPPSLPSRRMVVDFANRTFRGMLSRTSTQEEILLMLKPEVLALGRWLCDPLLGGGDDHGLESIVVEGARQYCTIVGYGSTAAMGRVLPPKNTPRSSVGEAEAGESEWSIAVIDAVINKKKTGMKMRRGEAVHGNVQDSEEEEETQYELANRLRCLEKAVTAFSHHTSSSPPCRLVIAGGKWGCGDFGGDLLLKVLQQWVAASCAAAAAFHADAPHHDVSRRSEHDESVELALYLFNDRLEDTVRDLVKSWKGCTVGDVCRRMLLEPRGDGGASPERFFFKPTRGDEKIQ